MSEIKIKYIKLDDIELNEFNPNEEDADKFNLLCESIKDRGLDTPIHVVEIEKGLYRVVHGEHRWKAAEVLGIEKIPCIVMKDISEDQQKFECVKRNMIAGKLNYIKLMKMVKTLSKSYNKEEIRKGLGFTKEAIIDKVFKEVEGQLRKIDPELAKQFKLSKKEIETIDDISRILHEIMKKYGDTLDYNFMFFTCSGQKHIVIKASKTVWKMAQELSERAVSEKKDINVYFERWMKDVKVSKRQGGSDEERP